MTRPDHPELTEHYRREFRRDLRDRVAAAEAAALFDNDPKRRESHRRHAEAVRRAMEAYEAAWGAGEVVVEGTEAATSWPENCMNPLPS